MRKMLLSLKPEIFELIRNKKKIFEYRHQFYTEEVGAYLYISKPIQKIVGYIEFDKRIELKDWEEKYKYNVKVNERINNYLSRNYKYAIPINKFKMTTEISLKDLRKNLEKFIIPESYYYLDNFIELKEYIENNIVFTNEVVENNFQIVKDEDICKQNY